VLVNPEATRQILRLSLPPVTVLLTSLSVPSYFGSIIALGMLTHLIFLEKRHLAVTQHPVAVFEELGARYWHPNFRAKIFPAATLALLAVCGGNFQYPHEGDAHVGLFG